MEQFMSKQKDLHMVFIDLQKTYDMVPRDISWWDLNRKQILAYFEKIIQETKVRATCGETKEVPLNVSFHQGSVLSPYLFAIVLGKITNDFQGTSLGA